MKGSYRVSALLVAGPLFLAACGGGGGGGGGGGSAPSQLTYARGLVLYPVGIAIEVNQPAVQGTVDQWSVQPALPAGLSLDPVTGELSGKPSELRARATYTVTASNAAGATTADIELETVKPVLLAIAANTLDDTLTTYVVDPVSGRLRPRGYVRAGANETTPRGITVHTNGRVVYVLNTIGGNLSLYDLDPATGRLTSRSVVPIAGPQPTEMLLHPTLDVAYVISKNAPQLSIFAVDPLDGDLTLLATVNSGAGSETGVLDRAGRFLYVADTGARTLSTFALDASTGVPTPAGAPVQTGKAPFSVVLGAGDRFAYVLNLRTNSVDVFALDALTGLPGFVASQPTGVLPARLAFEPRRRFLYVAISSDDTVRTYTADPVTGLLTESQPPTPSAERPASLAVDAAGTHLYVTGIDGPEIAAYAIEYDTGALTELGRARTREQPRHLALVGGDGPASPRPKFAYVGNRLSNDVSQYAAAAATGELAASFAPAMTGGAPRGMAADLWTRFLYCTNSLTDDVSSFAIDPTTGQLTAVGLPVPAGDEPRGAAVDPSGRFLYVAAQRSDDVTVFALDEASGSLSTVETEPAGDGAVAVGVDPTGRFAYVANHGSGDLSAYTIDAGSGALTSVGSPVPTAGQPSAIGFHPGGRCLYAALEDVDTLAVFDIDAQTGALTPAGNVATGVQPTSVAVDPLGRYVYTVDHDSGAIGSVSSFALDPATGLPTPLGRFLAGVNPIAAAVSPQGRFLYVANEGSDDISLFVINANNGVLFPGPTAAAGAAPSSIAVATELQ